MWLPIDFICIISSMRLWNSKKKKNAKEIIVCFYYNEKSLSKMNDLIISLWHFDI
jgi:hypothetical protein